DPRSRCALPELEKGHVTLQTLAVFTEKGVGSRRKGEGQIAAYYKMLRDYPQRKVSFVLAVENGSALLEEEEPLDLLFPRFDAERFLYVSLTWKEENRFG